MKKIPHKNIWHTGAVQIHVDPPPIHSIKSKNDFKLEKDCVKIKLRRYLMLEKFGMY